MALNKLIELLSEEKSTITTLFTKTSPKLKAGNPFSSLVKISRVNCVLNADYAKAVEKLGGEVKERAWGTKVGKSAVKNGNKKYVQVRPIKTDSIYMDGDKEIPFDQIKFYLPEFSEQVVPIRSYNLDNVIGIKYAGKLEAVAGFSEVEKLFK